ncbi:hypothetical protein [Phenylobacterium sp.]|jgi:hypothetical protein|uniref:hypothetical protein n=1 Tax=Phenylobacterium sp. TaxID=1871053 RepID=UPI002E321279|nr:hypothetical protein [Phenylobacterium sp.]HEX2559883.1 hypothetical protein [Phenylobacterium sp.]
MYICYLYEREGQVPHMEVLPEVPLAAARGLALDLLHQRPHYLHAELWDGEQMVSRFHQDRLRAPTRSGAAMGV